MRGVQLYGRFDAVSEELWRDLDSLVTGSSYSSWN